ncbi:MAG: site-2 protease family protein [Planctomycetota bacterium]
MSAADLLHGILVVFGVGLVIFVHELGHYLAARWAGAKVEVFSIGMGPKLFGWQSRGTLFQVAALPIGGYVKLAGEYPEAGRTAQPGELGSMSVFHRFVYYSGGVVMNVLFALVVMPIVLLVGLPGVEPVLGESTKGSPAWHARLEAGARVEAVNGHDPFDFMGLAMEIALSGKKPVELDLVLPGTSERVRVAVETEFDEDTGTRKLGVTNAVSPDAKLVVTPETPGAVAGLTNDDRLLGVVGQPDALSPLQQFQRGLERGGPVTIRVAGPDDVVREVSITPAEKRNLKRRLFGVMPMQNVVRDVRSAPADSPERPQFEAGDRIRSVAGRRIYWSSDFLPALLAVDGPFEIVVEREGGVVTLPSPGLSAAEKVALDADLFLDTDLDSSTITIQPGRAAALAGVLDGDRVMSVDGHMTTTWKEVYDAIQVATREDRSAVLEVWRAVAAADGGEQVATLAIEVTPAPAIETDYGIALATYMGVQRADSVPEALRVGALASWRLLANTWRTLQKMLFTDEVSTKNLGGIITISVLSFHSASQGMTQLFFLLAFISLNLAILNLLPIPILDGGHLMFLLVEGVKGTPVSERTLGYSQVVGLVLLLSLMIYVTYQDVVRWFLTT